MKTLCLLLALLPLLCHGDEPTLKDLLQQGLMAEEADGDLAKAAKAYEALVIAGDAQQKIVATGIYRLAEVRRKQDKKDEATRLYQRLLAEFPGQELLVKMARENLIAMGAAPAAPTTEAPPAGDFESQEIARVQKLFTESPDRARAERPLHSAAHKGWKRFMEAMIAKGFDVNQLGSQEAVDFERSPLSIAAEEGHKAVAELLIAHGADVNDARINRADMSDLTGNLPLIQAISHQRQDILRLLLDHGASLSIRTKLGENVAGTPLHLAVQAPKEGDALIKLLLDHHADLEAPTTIINTNQRPGPNDPAIGATPLALAAKDGKLTALKLLLDAGANVNAPDASGRTPLFDAYFFGEGKETADAITPLLDHGASLSVRDKFGRMPLAHLFRTAPLGQLGTRGLMQTTLPQAKLLLARGSDPKGTDNDGNSLLHLFLINRSDIRPGMPGPSSTSRDTSGRDKLEALLTSLGIDPALKNSNGETALDTGVRNGTAFGPLGLWLVARTATKDHGVWDCSFRTDAVVTSLYMPLDESEPLPSLAEFALLQRAHATHRAPRLQGMPLAAAQPHRIQPQPSASGEKPPPVLVRVIHHAAADTPPEELVQSFDLANDDVAPYKPLLPGDAVFIGNVEQQALPVEPMLAKLDLNITVKYSSVERRFHLGGDDDIWDPAAPELPWGLWKEILAPLIAAIAPTDLTKVKLTRQVNGKPVERTMNLASGIPESWPRPMSGDRIELVASDLPVSTNDAGSAIISLPDLGLAFANPYHSWPCPLSSLLVQFTSTPPPGRDWAHLKIWRPGQKEPETFDLAKAAAALQPDSDPEVLREAEPQVNHDDRIEVPALPGHATEAMNPSLTSYLVRVGGRDSNLPPGVLMATPPRRRVTTVSPGQQ